jgi:hypothetical protein
MVRTKLFSLLKNIFDSEAAFFPFSLLSPYRKEYKQIKLKKNLSVKRRHFVFRAVKNTV